MTSDIPNLFIDEYYVLRSIFTQAIVRECGSCQGKIGLASSYAIGRYIV